MNNSNTIYFIIGSFILILIIWVTVVFSFRAATPSTTTGTNQNDPFGFGIISNGPPVVGGTTQGGTQTGTQATSTMLVSSFGTVPLPVRDFLKDVDVITVHDKRASDSYSLGSFPYPYNKEGYATDTPKIPEALDRGYEILYFPAEKSFNVTILKEPLGEVRATAANDLAGRLGISTDEVCAVLVDVRIVGTANEIYGGRHVGFAGCKGAVKFPGD
jgi:hypothetical protein